jgi:hypothetical protein
MDVLDAESAMGVGGHSAIILNGSAGIYFECKKGIRQGDPFWSYLFLLAVEGL